VREVRVDSYLMHPPMLDEGGLSPALRWFAKGFAARSGIAVVVEIPEEFERYAQEVETTVFRTVQESLTNVHRYSGSSTATIRLWREEDRLHVEIQDSGSGLIAPALVMGRAGTTGVGIAGMRERVSQLSGDFEIESAPGRGTIVRVSLPVSVEPASRIAANPTSEGR
jgi:two-component system NarL family sensor kinase